MIDRTSARPAPWAGGTGEGERRPGRLPRPQAGLESRTASPERAPEVPAGREQLAVRILAKATATIPADLLLRQTLSRRKLLSRTDGAWISRAVFSTFRWQGWLDATTSAEDRLQKALSLADDYAISTSSISDDELRAKAIPGWTAEALDVSPAWLRSLQAEPALWLRTRPGMRDNVSTQLGFCEAPASAAFRDALRYDGQEDLYRNELFQAGAFEIQDIASQAVGILCDPKPGETWWDACAGEGGKTLHLSGLMEGKGLIWASDKAEWRLDRLKQRAGRAGCFNYRGVLWNGGPRPPTRTRFDGVLVDAPCSGVGTWGRNPHARWTTTPRDVEELAVLQRDLLSHAAASVKPGGKLVYAVCTLTRAETSGVTDAFTAAHPEFEPVLLSNPFAPNPSPSPSQFLWPQDTGGNGMFVAAWRRRADPASTPSNVSTTEE
ncbi:MAG: RsmB/NOP family class I SAM-dependent RNA methyltransferase [Verrucomicrobiales bacterium]|nr:RsmB/NOP family class I SAM-dependent RNA methyltransferase [Verrucomicrobiales bacterium]